MIFIKGAFQNGRPFFNLGLPASDSNCFELASNILRQKAAGVLDYSNTEIDARIYNFFTELQEYGWTPDKIYKTILAEYETLI